MPPPPPPPKPNLLQRIAQSSSRARVAGCTFSESEKKTTWKSNAPSPLQKDKKKKEEGKTYHVKLTNCNYRGKSIAQRLARDGYRICVNDVRSNAADADWVAAAIRAAGGQAISFTADVTARDEVDALVQAAVSQLGPLGAMVANAGIAQVKPLLDLTERDFKHMFDVNVYGVFNCYASAAKQMIEQGGGGKLLAAAR